MQQERGLAVCWRLHRKKIINPFHSFLLGAFPVSRTVIFLLVQLLLTEASDSVCSARCQSELAYGALPSQARHQSPPCRYCQQPLHSQLPDKGEHFQWGSPQGWEIIIMTMIIIFSYLTCKCSRVARSPMLKSFVKASECPYLFVWCTLGANQATETQSSQLTLLSSKKRGHSLGLETGQ